MCMGSGRVDGHGIPPWAVLCMLWLLLPCAMLCVLLRLLLLLAVVVGTSSHISIRVGAEQRVEEGVYKRKRGAYCPGGRKARAAMLYR